MAKIGNIDVGDFPLLLAPMEDVSDRLFALCVKNKVQMWCIPSLFQAKGSFAMRQKV